MNFTNMMGAMQAESIQASGNIIFSFSQLYPRQVRVENGPCRWLCEANQLILIALLLDVSHLSLSNQISSCLSKKEAELCLSHREQTCSSRGNADSPAITRQYGKRSLELQSLTSISVQSESLDWCNYLSQHPVCHTVSLHVSKANVSPYLHPT